MAHEEIGRATVGSRPLLFSMRKLTPQCEFPHRERHTSSAVLSTTDCSQRPPSDHRPREVREDAKPAEEVVGMWFGVRHVIMNGSAYEERITVWESESFEDAIARAEVEAATYAAEVLHDGHVLDLFQAYALPEPPGHGGEVFSLVRESALDPGNYLRAFFDTGDELQA